MDIYPYVTFADGTDVYHSGYEDNKVIVWIDKGSHNGVAQYELPGCIMITHEKFGKAELVFFNTFLKANEPVIMHCAQGGALYFMGHKIPNAETLEALEEGEQILNGADV